MENILLVHRKSNSKSGALPTNEGTLWTTCLRQILFVEEARCDFGIADGDEILAGPNAMGFLLEVLCGLHSPVLGETEVLGQFKNFVQSRRDAGDFLFSENQKWLNFLMTEAKRVRSEFVNGLGSNSYGSLIRRHTRESKSVSLLGAGQLAREILPWMSTKKSMQVVSRDPSKLQVFAEKWAHLKLETYAQPSDLNEVLVIAAPITDSVILDLLQKNGSKTLRIFDLRGEDNQLPTLLANTKWKVHSLNDLFSELNVSCKENQEKIKAIKNIITERVVQFTERSELRPLGWDDLCA